MNTALISTLSDRQLSAFLQKHRLALTLGEARSIPKKLGREPTLTELFIFSIQWSEHSSYKSSRTLLKTLPTKAPNVILGPSEDSGIIYLTTHNKERFGIVISHESHNHPSQVVPYEGAATGIGGILRDVLCMGADIIATADPLRFGNPNGKNRNRTRYIANAVIDGIAGYGNPVGIPVLAGDIYFDGSFDDNCLVNVVCLGLIKEKDIIHSYAPKNSAGYDVIIVGKATDNSGFGGASFASLTLDEDERESNRGAVQVPDPFLKNMIIRATKEVFNEIRKHDIPVGFKDMGAGGIMCATSELGSDANLGIDMDLDKVHTAFPLDPWVISCAETQERFCWIVPPSFTPKLLKIYNEDFALREVAEGAQASVVGKVTKEPQYVLHHKGEIVCDAPIQEVTKGVLYDRKATKPIKKLSEPKLGKIDFGKALLKVVGHENFCSRHSIYEHYDTTVIGRTVLPAGAADAGLLAPIPGNSVGVALAVDAIPRYGKISPYWAGANAVAEAMSNVVAIGARPSALTDCLNFGNPEKPEFFWEFKEAVMGIRDAAAMIGMPYTDHAVPIISGNVSFYNESSKGNAVAPSPIISCLGIMKDYQKAVTFGLKKAGSLLYLIGERKNELGGSLFYDTLGKLGKNVPKPEFHAVRAQHEAILKAIDKGLLLSCHDISDGGFASCLTEMAIQGDIGFSIALPRGNPVQTLFSESPGFVIEIPSNHQHKIENLLHGIPHHYLGTVGGDRIKFGKIIDLPLKKAQDAWYYRLQEVLS
ncbi:MAG: phosphoribosylformylglycinamidine synthase subunit PurL [Nanoarchaeota archaeon]